MSEPAKPPRINPKAGFVYGPRPTGPTGRPLCRGCEQECPKGRRTFCSTACVDAWKITTDPTHVRRLVQARDRGVCRACRLDTLALSAFFEQARKQDPSGYRFLGWLKTKLGVRGRYNYWDADHIVEVADGGGCTGLENYQTLCVWCHREKSGASRRARAAARIQAKQVPLFDGGAR